MKNSIITFVFSLILSVSFGQEPATKMFKGKPNEEFSVQYVEFINGDTIVENVSFRNRDFVTVEIYNKNKDKFEELTSLLDSLDSVVRRRKGMTYGSFKSEKFKITFNKPGNYVLIKEIKTTAKTNKFTSRGKISLVVVERKTRQKQIKGL